MTVFVGTDEWQPDDPRFVAPGWTGCLFLEDGLIWASREVVDEKFFSWWKAHDGAAATPEELKQNFGLIVDDADYLKGLVWSWFRHRTPGVERLLSWSAVLTDETMLEASLDAAKNVPDGLKWYAYQKEAPLHGRLAVLRSDNEDVRERGSEARALLPDWVFEELLSDENPDVRTGVQQNSLAPIQYRFASLAADDEKYHGADFFYWESGEEVTWAMASMESYVKKYGASLAGMARLPAEGWRLLTLHHDASVRSELALNWELPPQFQYLLARDPSPTVRGHLAGNEQVVPELREQLSHDADLSVRLTAKRTMMFKEEQSLEFFMRHASTEMERIALYQKDMFAGADKALQRVHAGRALAAVQDWNPDMRAAGVLRMHQSNMHVIYNEDCPSALIPALLRLASSSEDGERARVDALNLLLVLAAFPKHRLLQPFGDETAGLLQLRKEMLEVHWPAVREHAYRVDEKYRDLPDEWVLRLII